ncbi:hypothetical protein FHY55_17475 [Oceanicola sp. D3]|uniref:hypothetical protein n=1 Tax=Oceanicola sp. D3 TaxID=2587163 RepID=UPI001124062F|nr:hypothetical protein [Oceanicola sp. D3]QDC10915.1 hypothetical protein FHY55_17475 [Oceanicola sp. D3]
MRFRTQQIITICLGIGILAAVGSGLIEDRQSLYVEAEIENDTTQIDYVFIGGTLLWVAFARWLYRSMWFASAVSPLDKPPGAFRRATFGQGWTERSIFRDGKKAAQRRWICNVDENGNDLDRRQ